MALFAIRLTPIQAPSYVTYDWFCDLVSLVADRINITDRLQYGQGMSMISVKTCELLTIISCSNSTIKIEKYLRRLCFVMMDGATCNDGWRHLTARCYNERKNMNSTIIQDNNGVCCECCFWSDLLLCVSVGGINTTHNTILLFYIHLFQISCGVLPTGCEQQALSAEG